MEKPLPVVRRSLGRRLKKLSPDFFDRVKSGGLTCAELKVKKCEVTPFSRFALHFRVESLKKMLLCSCNFRQLAVSLATGGVILVAQT